MVLCDSTSVPRNAETVLGLIASRVLPVEASPPESIYLHPSSIYSRWLKSLPQRLKDMVLPYMSTCSIAQELKEVGKGWGWGPHVPFKPPPQCTRNLSSAEMSLESRKTILGSIPDNQDRGLPYAIAVRQL